MHNRGLGTRTVLEDHGHWRTLVQNPQLPLGTLFISRVGENTPVQQRPVGICHHTADIPRTVWLRAFPRRVLQTVEIVFDWSLPVHAVPLVDTVDRAGSRHLHIRMGQDELAQCIVHGESVDAASFHRNHELGTGAIHGEAGSHELCSRQQQLLLLALTSLGQLEDAEDGPDTDSRVQIARAVDRVADNGVPGFGRVVENDAVLLFFRHEQFAFAGGAHRADEEVVADDVELFLVIACRVGGARQAGEVDECGSSDVVGYRFEGELEGVAEESRLY